MAGLTLPRLRRLAAGFPGQVAVETGTFEADTTRLLLQRFAWDELRAIAQRNQADRVVVDDVHAFGRREKGWETVTQQRLRHALPRIRYCRVLGDQWVAQLRAE